MNAQILSPQALNDRLNEGKPLVIIDTMIEDHFKAVHLPGAMNICVYEIIFLDNIAKHIPDKGQEIVVYGSSDKSLEGATAAEKLVGAGYRNVCVLKGGLKGWKEFGFELEGDDVPILERFEPILPLEDTGYEVDCDQSTIHWFGRNRNTTHHGTLRLSAGQINIQKGKIKGAFEIDMTSIKDIDLEGDPLQSDLIAHLKSEDFFFIKLFPKAVFTITDAEQVEEVPSSLPNFRVQGLFELRGLKNDIEFLATVSPIEDGVAKVEAHFDIDRTRWGVLYGSSRFFEHLGYHLVYNLISIQLRLVVRIKT